MPPYEMFAWVYMALPHHHRIVAVLLFCHAALADQSHRNAAPLTYAPVIRHTHYNLHYRERASPTALCMAGEARTITQAKVQEQHLATLLEPLQAALFLVLSPKWSNRENFQAIEARRKGSAPFTLTAAKLEEIVQRLHPVSTVVAKDEDMERVLRELHRMNASEVNAIRKCAQLQPLPKKIEEDTREQGQDGEAWMVSHFQLGPCSPQLGLALRFRACLSLIELAEQQRTDHHQRDVTGQTRLGQPRYSWVVRTRPDVRVACAPQIALMSELRARHAVLFQDDYIAVMPREAADISMRQVPLGHRLNVSQCNYKIMGTVPKFLRIQEDDDAKWHTMESCNPCLLHLSGWSVYHIGLSIWSSRQQHFFPDEQPWALPWREEDMYDPLYREAMATCSATPSWRSDSEGARDPRSSVLRLIPAHIPDSLCFGSSGNQRKPFASSFWWPSRWG